MDSGKGWPEHPIDSSTGRQTYQKSSSALSRSIFIWARLRATNNPTNNPARFVCGMVGRSIQSIRLVNISLLRFDLQSRTLPVLAHLNTGLRASRAQSPPNSLDATAYRVRRPSHRLFRSLFPFTVLECFEYGNVKPVASTFLYDLRRSGSGALVWPMHHCTPMLQRSQSTTQSQNIRSLSWSVANCPKALPNCTDCLYYTTALIAFPGCLVSRLDVVAPHLLSYWCLLCRPIASESQ